MSGAAGISSDVEAVAAARNGMIGRVFVARGLRAFGDGYVAILLPVHLGRLGYDPTEIGLIATTTLLGSALLTLALGAAAHRLRLRQGLLAAALLMAGTGLGFGALEQFWPLLLVAFVGTINPSGGDVSVFLPMEHTVIAQSVADRARTDAFARYSFIGSIGAALGALAIGALDWLEALLPGVYLGSALFLLYGGIDLVTLLLYAGLPEVRSNPAPWPILDLPDVAEAASDGDLLRMTARRVAQLVHPVEEMQCELPIEIRGEFGRRVALAS